VPCSVGGAVAFGETTKGLVVDCEVWFDECRNVQMLNVASYNKLASLPASDLQFTLNPRGKKGGLPSSAVATQRQFGKFCNLRQWWRSGKNLKRISSGGG